MKENAKLLKAVSKHNILIQEFSKLTDQKQLPQLSTGYVNSGMIFLFTKEEKLRQQRNANAFQLFLNNKFLKS